MSNTPAARLANLKVRFASWTITKSLPETGLVGYTAVTYRAGKRIEIRATTLTGLETRLTEES